MSVPPCPYNDVESRASHVMDSLGVAHVLTNTRRTSWEQSLYVNRTESVPCVTDYILRKKHECFKPYCPNCNQNKAIGHFCSMQPLKNEILRSDNVLFVFHDFETTQDTKFSENATEHIPILVCAQQCFTTSEIQNDTDMDCERCGRRRHSFYEDPIGDLLSYFCEPRP